MAGSAAPAAGFLLVEQPGGWGRQALTSSRLDPRVGAALSARAIAVGLRVLLIRRPGRHPAPVRRSWAVVSARPGREATWWGEFGADDELRSLPLDGSAGTRSTEPFYLVCTHGRHDQCCAIEGRPVAEALHRLRPGSVWECSHVGGDRFAANVVAMPHGVYYGRVEPARVADLVAAHERAEVLPDLVRGRSTAVPAAQAAIAHVRRTTGEAAARGPRSGRGPAPRRRPLAGPAAGQPAPPDRHRAGRRRRRAGAAHLPRQARGAPAGVRGPRGPRGRLDASGQASGSSTLVGASWPCPAAS